MHLFSVSLWVFFCVVIVNNLQPKIYAQKVSNVFFFFTLIEYHNTKCIVHIPIGNIFSVVYYVPLQLLFSI